jgi:hypothetical protein
LEDSRLQTETDETSKEYKIYSLGEEENIVGNRTLEQYLNFE